MYKWLIVLHVDKSRQQQLDSLQLYAYMEKKKVKYNHYNNNWGLAGA